MRILSALVALVAVSTAHACLPVVHVWPPGAPKPGIVVEGVVARHSRPHRSERTLHVEAQHVLRGRWMGAIDVPVPCAASWPEVGEHVIVVRWARGDAGWVLIPGWQEQDFLDFLDRPSAR